MKKLFWVSLLAVACINAEAAPVEEYDDDTVMATVMLTCAATNAILAATAPEPAASVMTNEALRFKSYILPQYHHLIAKAIDALSWQYNNGQVTWDEMVDVGQACASISE